MSSDLCSNKFSGRLSAGLDVSFVISLQWGKQNGTRGDDQRELQLYQAHSFLQKAKCHLQFSPRRCRLLRAMEDTLINCPILEETKEPED